MYFRMQASSFRPGTKKNAFEIAPNPKSAANDSRAHHQSTYHITSTHKHKSPSSMITLHHLENSRSIRILWLLEELGLDYTVVVHSRNDLGLADDKYKELHPIGKSPILIDGDTVIAESGAMIEYLLDYYGEDSTLRPPIRTSERNQYNYWLHASEGSIMNLTAITLVLNRMDSKTPFMIRPVVKAITSKVRASYVTPNIEKILGFVEATLGKNKWFAGDDFTAADIQMGFTMQVLAARCGLDEQYPNCQRWIEQAEERPAWKRAVEKGGSLSLSAD